VSGDLLPEFKHHDAASESNRKPTAAAREPPNSFTELELCDLGAKCVVPENYLVWGVQRTGAATEQEEKRRGMQRDHCRKSTPSEF
jgi:hypothetical protein